MTTVDNLLLTLITQTSPAIEDKVPGRDAKVLRSIATAISDPNFITESQSKLLVKILLTYKSFLETLVPNFLDIVEQGEWSRPFRAVDKTKKIYLRTDRDKNTEILVEFAHSVTIRKVMQTIHKDLEGGLKVLSSRFSSAELTEKNIVTLVEKFKPHGFEIEEKILNFYENMKKWDFPVQCENLIFGENLNLRIKDKLAQELTESDLENTTLVSDRSIRYHYFTKKTEENSKNLENLIANRTQTRVWVDSNNHTLVDLFKSLQNLKRLPTLVVFDNWNTDQCFEHLQKMSESLENSGITDNVGIYFRLENLGSGKSFNTFIGDKRYNAQLDANTQVACVQAGKLPKFFLKDCNWSPKSVIVLGNNLRHSKTAVYSNRCDLVVSFSDKKSIFDTSGSWNKDTWVL